MSETTWSLLDLLANVASNPAARAQLEADPKAFMEAHGFEDLRAEDVHHAIPLVADNLSTMLDSPFEAGVAPPDPHPLPGETDADAALKQINFIADSFHGAVGDPSALDGEAGGVDPSRTLDEQDWVDSDGFDRADDQLDVAEVGFDGANGFGQGFETAGQPSESMDGTQQADDNADLADTTAPPAEIDDPGFDSDDLDFAADQSAELDESSSSISTIDPID